MKKLLLSTITAVCMGFIAIPAGVASQTSDIQATRSESSQAPASYSVARYGYYGYGCSTCARPCATCVRPCAYRPVCNRCGYNGYYGYGYRGGYAYRGWRGGYWRPYHRHHRYHMMRHHRHFHRR